MSRHKKIRTAQLCECGCGQFAKPGNRFINGHQNRGINNPIYGKQRTDKTKNKIGLKQLGIPRSPRSIQKQKETWANPDSGYRNPESSRRKSKTVKLNWTNTTYAKSVSDGIKKSWGNPNSGMNSAERSLKLSKSKQEAWADPSSVYNSPSHRITLSVSHLGLPSKMLGRHFSDDARKNMGVKPGYCPTKQARENMRRARIKYMSSGKMKWKDTEIELKFEQELITNSIPYQKQVPLCSITIVDFLLLNKVVIYCDGNYVHSLPKAKIRDSEQNKVLSSSGYKVYRFTETEINKSVIGCLNKISEIRKN